jgi:carboxymethylenebutenolidase
MPPLCSHPNKEKSIMDNITEAKLAVAVDDGTMNGFLATPASGSGPGIVMLQEIFGVNEAMRAKAREFASRGFTVLVPDLFWRQEPDVDLGYDEDSRAKGFRLMQGFDFDKGVADCRAAFAALAQHPSCTASPAIVGYCMGGKLAVLLGAVEPEARAVVAFYGVKLNENIEQIKATRAPVMLHFGDRDAHIPNEVSEMLRDTFKDTEGVDVFIYPGAQHGFFNPVRQSVFDPGASEKAMERTLALLNGKSTRA